MPDITFIEFLLSVILNLKELADILEKLFFSTKPPILICLFFSIFEEFNSEGM